MRSAAIMPACAEDARPRFPSGGQRAPEAPPHAAASPGGPRRRSIGPAGNHAMGMTHLRTIWSTLVQSLVDAEGQGVRARILLEDVARESWVEACGLWRRESGADSWTCLLVRGSPARLHDRDFLEEVAAGRKPHDFVPGRGVLIAGQSAGALALTYAGSPESEFDLDLLAGLLHVARLVDS